MTLIKPVAVINVETGEPVGPVASDREQVPNTSAFGTRRD